MLLLLEIHVPWLPQFSNILNKGLCSLLCSFSSLPPQSGGVYFTILDLGFTYMTYLDQWSLSKYKSTKGLRIIQAVRLALLYVCSLHEKTKPRQVLWFLQEDKKHMEQNQSPMPAEIHPWAAETLSQAQPRWAPPVNWELYELSKCLWFHAIVFLITTLYQ